MNHLSNPYPKKPPQFLIITGEGKHRERLHELGIMTALPNDNNLHDLFMRADIILVQVPLTEINEIGVTRIIGTSERFIYNRLLVGKKLYGQKKKVGFVTNPTERPLLHTRPVKPEQPGLAFINELLTRNFFHFDSLTNNFGTKRFTSHPTDLDLLMEKYERTIGKLPKPPDCDDSKNDTGLAAGSYNRLLEQLEIVRIAQIFPFAGMVQSITILKATVLKFWRRKSGDTDNENRL